MISVLLVDDTVMVHHAIEAMLKEIDHIIVVDVLTSCDDLLNAVTTHSPEVILLDLMYEGRDGFEIYDVLNQLSELRQSGIVLKVLIFSSKLDADLVLEAEQLGIDGYLFKNDITTCDNLVEAIEGVVAGEFVASHRIDQIRRADIKTASDYQLTPFEFRVLSLLTKGYDSHEIIRITGLSPSAFYKHTHNLREKLGVRSNTSVVTKAIAERLVSIQIV